MILNLSLIHIFDQSERTIFSFVDNIDFVCLCVAEYEESMSKKIHLDAGIFRIHWFDAKAFCTDNADLIIDVYKRQKRYCQGMLCRSVKAGKACCLGSE